MTNGDMIRKLTDEELARLFGTIVTQEINRVVDGGFAKSIKEWKEFMTQEYMGFNGV